MMKRGEVAAGFIRRNREYIFSPIETYRAVIINERPRAKGGLGGGQMRRAVHKVNYQFGCKCVGGAVCQLYLRSGAGFRRIDVKSHSHRLRFRVSTNDARFIYRAFVSLAAAIQCDPQYR